MSSSPGDSPRYSSRHDRAGRSGWWPKLSCLVAAIIILGAWNLTQSWRLNRVSLLFPKDSERHVLVLYIFAATDPQFIENLRYFVKEAVQHDTECEYVIVIQQSPTDKAHWAKMGLPALPRHARYVYHPNECYDWGTFGWVLRSGYINTSKYKYFIFMNCSVRGPFLPAYAKGKLHWTLPLLSRLTAHVKLVGPSISCEGSPLNGDFSGKWRHNPHVQSYVVATDQEGLRVLRADARVFHCHNSRWNTIYYSELGASHAMLRAGYTIDSLMAKYQGVDWRNKSNWECNSRYTCQIEHSYDGLTLDPHEVLFIKFKSFTLHGALSSSVKAMKLSQWQESPANLSHVLDNAYSSNLQKYKLHDVLIAKARGASCFDFEHYLLHNPDLRSLGRQSSLWKHFVQFGQFEGRAHKFICNLDFASLATGKGTKNKTVSATRGKAATAAVHAAGSAGDADRDAPVAPAPPKERKKAVVSVSALDPTALLLATAGS